MFHVELDLGARGRTTEMVKADSFIEGEHGITFYEDMGHGGLVSVKWLPSDQVISISLVDPT